MAARRGCHLGTGDNAYAGHRSEVCRKHMHPLSQKTDDPSRLACTGAAGADWQSKMQQPKVHHI